jgi:ectoine hydroxylase-related dioxygenase (phytanoyl-CoA dioxygenase family)
MVFKNETALEEARNYLHKEGFSMPFYLQNPGVLQGLSKRTLARKKKDYKWLPFTRKKPELSGRDRLNRHLDLPPFQSLVRDNNLIYCLKNLCRPDLLLWRSNIFIKEPGAPIIHWHHDKHFEDRQKENIDLNDTESHFSVLVALDDMTETNGAFQVLPQSHRPLEGLERDLRIKTKKSSGEHFIEQLPPEFADSAITIPLEKGQFVIFHSGLLHRSLRYESGEPRMSIALRFVASDVKMPGNDYIGIPREQFVKI